MDILATVRALPAVRGQRLSAWLERFLVADPAQLDNWVGKFTEVMTAKAVAILRKRGVLEEAEADRRKFDRLLTIAQRLPAYKPEVVMAASPATPTTNPLIGRTLRFDSGEYESKNRAFFARLTVAPQGTEVVYYEAGEEYYDVLLIAGEARLEAIPAPVFAGVADLPNENFREHIAEFLEGWFTLSHRTRDEWERMPDSTDEDEFVEMD